MGPMNSTGSGEKFPILLAPSEATRYITTAIRRYSALFDAIARFLGKSSPFYGPFFEHITPGLAQGTSSGRNYTKALQIPGSRIPPSLAQGTGSGRNSTKPLQIPGAVYLQVWPRALAAGYR